MNHPAETLQPLTSTKVLMEFSADDHPLVSIRAGRRRMPLDLRELWAHRELLYLLAWRDVKVRYKQTVLGGAWAILQPLLSALVFTIFFGRLARVPSDGVPYPLFSYAGMLPWTFFANALTQSGQSLVSSSHIITKVYFPRLVVPVAAVLAGLVDFALASAVMFAMMGWYGVSPGIGTAMFVPLTLVESVFAIGAGLWLSALNVKYRDIRHALPFAIQLWMFATPIIYPASMVPARWRLLVWLNPMSGLIEGYKSALFARAFHWDAIAYSAVFAVTLVYLGSLAFLRIEREFADVI
jgi:lipopolysaccharide transport system permease protein